MMEFGKPMTVRSRTPATAVRSRSACKGTPQMPQASGQLGEPTNTGKGVLIPVAVDVEPPQQQPNEQPQQQLQQQQQKKPPRAPTSGCVSLLPAGGSSQLPQGRPPSGSVNLPVGRPGPDASMNLPKAPTKMKRAGGSVHVPSVGPVCYSGLSSDIQLQCSEIHHPDKGGSPQVLTPESTTSSTGVHAARENSMPARVYFENVPLASSLSYSAPASPTSSAIHGLTRSAMGHRRDISPSRTRSIEQLGVTMPPSARARCSTGPILSNTRPPIGHHNVSQISGPPGPPRAGVPMP